MSPYHTRVLVFGFFIAAAAAVAASQDRGTGAVASVSHVSAGYKPINLQVLPKDISGAELDALMQQYRLSLGQSCSYCHEENRETKQIDYASDENPAKSTARLMISMTNDLNTKYLAQLGDRRYAESFTCGNCHRGQVHPPAFEPKA